MRYLALCSAVLFGASNASAQLSYNIPEGETVAYKVTIVFDSPAEKDTMTGVIVYEGQSASNDRITVKYSGGLSSRKQSKAQSRGPGGFRGPRGPGGFRGPGGPRGPSRFRGPGGPPGSPFANRGGISFDGLRQTTNTLNVAPNGEVLSMRGESQLPYLLGNLSIIPFEPLPAGSEKSWESANGITVTEEEESSFPRPPFTNNTTTKTGGSEGSTYEVTKEDGDLVEVAKTYYLISPAVEDDEATHSIEGSGTFTFNRKLSMPESLSMKMTYKAETESVTVKSPLTINYQRLSAEELAANRKQRQQAIAQARSKTAINREAWSEEIQQQYIEELQSSDLNKVRRRLALLNAQKPHTDEVEVAKAIEALINHEDRLTKNMANIAWKRWKVIVEETDADKK